jgi:predicted membrane chloride channel (bestrophin family)
LTSFLLKREHLHGSTGNVGPPIIARLQQYQSDGFLWYNSARKLSYIPFPFPHSQITTLFVMLTIFIIPVLMVSFASVWLGAVLTFFTVTLFVGLNEVSKELEV